MSFLIDIWIDIWKDGILGKTAIILLIVVVVLLGIAVCARVVNSLNYVPEGTVVDKDYTPASELMEKIGRR